AGHLDQAESLLAKAAASQRVASMLERFLPALRVRLDLLQRQPEAAQRTIERHRFDRLWWASSFQDELTYREWDLIGVCLCHLALFQNDFIRARQTAVRLEQIARLSGRGRTLVKALTL